MTAAQPSGSFSIISSSASFRNRIFQNRHPCLRKSPGRNRKYISFKRGCQGEKAVLKKGIQGAVNLLRNVGQGDDMIKAAIMKQYDLTEDEAEEYIYSNV